MTLCVASLPVQAYFRQGVALQYLGRHADALAAFASGLAQDPKSLQLLVGMVEAAMKSPLRGKKFSSCICLCLCVDSILMCMGVTVFLLHHLHVLSYSFLKACLSDNPHTLSVNKLVGVTFPSQFFAHTAGSPSLYLSVFLPLWLTVGVKYLPPDSELRCLQLQHILLSVGWSHTKIARYLNEHPTLMPLYVSAPCKPFFWSWVDL